MESSHSFWARMRLEMALGPNVECLQCGHIFLQHEDGCPHCGAGARTGSIVPEVRYEDCEKDRSPNGYCFILFKSGGFQIVSNKNFSHWPREMEKDGDFYQVTFDKETGQFHFLDGSVCPWPREDVNMESN